MRDRPSNDPDPLILALRMDPDAAARFTALRRSHFPPERNWLDAHVTLFHRLPPEHVDALAADLAALAARTAPFGMRTERLVFLGRGVAYRLASPQAAQLRRALAQRWHALLGAQDRAAGWTPHVTVQNKARPEAARALLGTLQASFVPEPVGAVGLDLWRYRGGPWEHARGFAFSA
jgi:hypothetical protein